MFLLMFMSIPRKPPAAIYSPSPAAWIPWSWAKRKLPARSKTPTKRPAAAKLTGRVLNGAFQRAFQVVKAIRTKTQIGRGATSVGSVAVQLAEKILGGDFHDKTVMIIGAGKMGEACVRHIAKKGIRSIIVANRSLEHAEEPGPRIRRARRQLYG